MIGSLRGTVLERSARSTQAGELLLEVGGIGYRLVVPASALSRIPQAGEPVFLHVHTHVREDAITLYGFPSREERVCFELLIGSHGVGPSVALALLSVHSPTALRRAVAQEDAEALMLVPGIGRKTALRLLVELRSRLEAERYDSGLELLAGSASGGEHDRDLAARARQELRAALAGLGYAAEEIRQVLAGIPSEGSLEDQLRAALRELSVAR